MDTAYAECLSIFSEQYNFCCLVKTIRAQVASRDKPWITNGLIMLVVRKTDCKKYGFILKRLQLNPDTKLKKINLPRYLEHQVKEHYSKLLSDAKGNIKDTWTIFNAAMNTKKSSTEFPSNFELNGTNIVNKQTIADEFNNFFINVGPNLAKNIPAVNNAASIYDYMGQQHLNSMSINPVNEAEVIRIIK